MTYERDEVLAALAAQRVRLVVLEQRLRDTSDAFLRAQRAVREVLDGSGASLEEKLRASVAMAEVSGVLSAPEPSPEPSPAQIEREYVERPGGKVISLGARIRHRTDFYAGLATLEKPEPKP